MTSAGELEIKEAKERKKREAAAEKARLDAERAAAARVPPEQLFVNDEAYAGFKFDDKGIPTHNAGAHAGRRVLVWYGGASAALGLTPFSFFYFSLFGRGRGASQEPGQKAQEAVRRAGEKGEVQAAGPDAHGCRWCLFSHVRFLLLSFCAPTVRQGDGGCLEINNKHVDRRS